jgi:hypothetical protein
MPGTLTYSGAEYPLVGEANDPPADFLRFGDDIDTLLVLKATNQLDRDTRFANVDAGTLVSCAAAQTIWMKLTTPPTAASWLVVYQKTEVTTGVVTAGANFTTSAQWARIQSALVSVKLTLVYGSTDITGSSDGNITDTTVGTVSANYRPPQDWNVVYRSNIAMWNGTIQADGAMIIATGVPTAKLRAGDFLIATGTYPQT